MSVDFTNPGYNSFLLLGGSHGLSQFLLISRKIERVTTSKVGIQLLEATFIAQGFNPCHSIQAGVKTALGAHIVAMFQK
jgi:hypothetical protein